MNWAKLFADMMDGLEEPRRETVYVVERLRVEDSRLWEKQAVRGSAYHRS